MKRLTYIILAILFLASCKKDEKRDAQVETLSATDIIDTQATLWGKITEQGTAGIREYGIELNGSRLPHTVTRADSFGVQVTDLKQGQQYRYRAYAVENSNAVRVGAEKSFTTLTPADFQFRAINITHQSADIEFQTADLLSDWGVYYKAGGAATVNDTKVEANGAGVITLTGLEPATYYYILGYATDKNGVPLSATAHFQTAYAEPQLSVPAITNITIAGAAVTFEVISTGGGETMPQLNIRYRAAGTENWAIQNLSYAAGDITYTLTGLNPGTKYEVQAYAQNHGNKSSYSATAEFTTLGTVPMMATPAVAAETSYRVKMTGGKVSDNGLLDITEYGFCWSTEQGAATADSYMKVTAGSENSFDYLSYDLLAGTTYYVRSYAKNPAGTGYSEEVTVTTPNIVYGEVDDWYILGKKYPTVQIGNQTWMAEDLVNTDGVSTTFSGTQTQSSVCPTGWHIPTRAEWDELIVETGGTNIAPKTLRIQNEACSYATNSAGLNIIPNPTGGHNQYWTSDIYYNMAIGGIPTGFYFVFIYNVPNSPIGTSGTITSLHDVYTRVLSVRCIKD